MSDTSNHYIGRNNEPQNDNTGCLFVLITIAILLMFFSAIISIEGCAHPKNVTKTSSTVVTTSKAVQDYSSRIVTIHRSDTTTVTTDEFTETEISFVTTDYDTLGHIIRTTNGNVKKRTDKSKTKSRSSRKSSVDSTKLARSEKSDSSAVIDTKSVVKEKSKLVQRTFAWIGFLAVLTLILCLAVAFIYWRKKH